MTRVAVAVQVYALTGSSFAVGLVGLATAVPLLVLGLAGGSVADAVDRRRLVLGTGSALAVLSLALAGQAVAGWRSLWLLYLLVAGQSALNAVQAPASRTFAPRLLGPERQAAAQALGSLRVGGLTGARGQRLLPAHRGRRGRPHRVRSLSLDPPPRLGPGAGRDDGMPFCCSRIDLV